MEEGFECTHCGSTRFEDMDKERIRCSFCGSIYPAFSDEPSIIIRKGANVIFGKNSKVELKGGVEIQEGAKVEIQGEMTSGKSKKKHEFMPPKGGISKHEKGDA